MPRRTFVHASFAFFSSLCIAQTPVHSEACLHGETRDASGYSITSAAIALRSSENDQPIVATSGPSGEFAICGLTPGTYHITVHRDSYLDQTLETSVRPSGNDVVAIVLVAHDALALRDVGQSPFRQSDPRQTELTVSTGSIREATLPNGPSASQTDSLHGQLYGLMGRSLVDRFDVLPGQQLPLAQFGGALGASLREAGTSFFLSFDQTAVNRQRLLSNLAGQVGAGNTGLLADRNMLTASAFASRVDRKFSDRDSAYVRYTRDQLQGNSVAQGAIGPNMVQQSVGAGNTVSLSGVTTNESRVQFTSSEVQLPPGAAAAGLQSELPTTRRNRVFEAANNIYRQVGSQSLRLGGDFLYNQMNLSFMQMNLGRTSGIGPTLSQATENTGVYAQSARQLRSDLVLTTGVRYDLQSTRGLQTDFNNFSPQLGLAWSPASHTVLRAGLGMNYSRVPLPLFAGSADPGIAANLADSASISQLGRTSLGSYGNFQTTDPTIQNAYAQHATLEAEQQIGKKSALTAQYQYVRGVQLALPTLRTAALCASTTACNSGNEFTGQQVGSGATSSYSGFTVAYTQAPVRWGNYKVAYTYSRTEGAGTGLNASYIADQMRRLSFTGVLHTSLNPGSTLWQQVTHGFVLTGTTDYMNRSEFLGMNFINLNARLSKSLVANPRFHIEAMAETFNMFQRTNASFSKAAEQMGEGASEVFSVYKRVATAQSPNGTQAGLKLRF